MICKLSPLPTQWFLCDSQNIFQWCKYVVLWKLLGKKNQSDTPYAAWCQSYLILTSITIFLATLTLNHTASLSPEIQELPRTARRPENLYTSLPLKSWQTLVVPDDWSPEVLLWAQKINLLVQGSYSDNEQIVYVSLFRHGAKCFICNFKFNFCRYTFWLHCC